MTGTNVVCGAKTCRYNSTSGCKKKAVVMDSKGKCLSLEKETAAAGAEGAAQGATEGVLNYGA